MNETRPPLRVSEDPSELTSAFNSQLSAIRQRLRALDHASGRLATRERQRLQQQEIAWQLGIVLVRRTTAAAASELVDLLRRNAERSDPAGEVFGAMAAMVAIRALWSSALRAPEGHPARGGLCG